MTSQKALEKISLGENISCEFKRCGGNIERDVLETVCSFLNRWGGDIFLGVADDGEILGVPKNAVKDLVRNFNSCLNLSCLSIYFFTQGIFFYFLYQ